VRLPRQSRLPVLVCSRRCKLSGVARFAKDSKKVGELLCCVQEGGGAGVGLKPITRCRIPVTPYQPSRSMPYAVIVHESTCYVSEVHAEAHATCQREHLVGRGSRCGQPMEAALDWQEEDEDA